MCYQIRVLQICYGLTLILSDLIDLRHWWFLCGKCIRRPSWWFWWNFEVYRRLSRRRGVTSLLEDARRYSLSEIFTTFTWENLSQEKTLVTLIKNWNLFKFTLILRKLHHKLEIYSKSSSFDLFHQATLARCSADKMCLVCKALPVARLHRQ